MCRASRRNAVVADLPITTYLTGNTIYLYLPLIPDFALARDRLSASAPR